MSASGSRALRGLVAEMAQLADDDLQAILDELDAGSRGRLMEMIETFRSGDAAPRPVRHEAAATAPAPGDWLVSRLQARDPAVAGMTPHALQALRRVAQEAGWVSARPAPAANDQRGLLARLGLRP